MRAVVQRVLSADVKVEREIRAAIGPGLLVYVAVARGDDDGDADYIAEKVVGLRIFPDEHGKMNLSVRQSGGQTLVVSAFTVLADARKGRRPALAAAADHEDADRLYRRVCDRIVELGVAAQPGVFAAYMRVEAVNDGPICILLDSTRIL